MFSEFIRVRFRLINAVAGLPYNATLVTWSVRQGSSVEVGSGGRNNVSVLTVSDRAPLPSANDRA